MNSNKLAFFELAHKLKPYVILGMIVVVSIFLIWAPFWFRIGPRNSSIQKIGFELIYRTYDGPLYSIAAQTLYRPDKMYALGTFEPEYFAVHPPGFPMLISLVSPINGYLNGMLLINFVATILLSWALYYFFHRILHLQESIYLVALVLLTPRMLISSSTGSSEIIFIFTTVMALILIHKNHYFFAGLFAMYSSFTRVPGVLLGLAIFCYLLLNFRDIKSKFQLVVPMLMSFAGVVAMCALYHRQYGDFYAYLHSGVVVQAGLSIYPQFLINAKNIGDKYIEDILFYFGIAWITLLGKSKELPPLIRIYAWIHFIFILTISHREMSRYILPLIPFLIAMQNDWLRKRHVKLGLLFLLPAVYMYIINFIANFTYPLPINLLK